MKQTSRKHHFIPALYTKRWAVNHGKLLEWSRPHRIVQPQPRHPNATGYEIDLNSFDDLPPDTRQWFEDTFLKLTDDLASKALDLIVSGRMGQLDLKLRSAWSRFLITLYLRHPDVLREQRAAVVRIWAARDEHSAEKYEKIRKEGQPATLEEYLASLTPAVHAGVHMRLLQAGMDNKKVIRHINSMAWEVFDVSAADNQLLTSDWPVELALGAPSPLVSLPISPTQLFAAADDPNILLQLRAAHPDKIVTEINRNVVGRARRYVFSTNERQAVFIRNRMSTQMVKPPFLPHFPST